MADDHYVEETIVKQQSHLLDAVKYGGYYTYIQPQDIRLERSAFL
jgi:hypothetical protein